MKTQLAKKSGEKKQITAAANRTVLVAKNSAISLEDNRAAAIVQQKQIAAIQANIPIQKKKNNTGLPDTLKSGMENLSGHSMDDVKVHYNSSKPAQLNAHAYAQGTNIHLASGQEKHLPHEAWHVVQQKQGRVKPTIQTKGVAINDNLSLEKEADVMGAKALQRKEISNRKLSHKTDFGVIQLGKKLTPSKRLEKLRKSGFVTSTSTIKRVGKKRPKSLDGYLQTTVAGRKYYSRKDSAGRVLKFAGGLKYSKTTRKATPKVAYKRKNDAAGHLIAHSFGGPAKFTDNFVAMNKTINSAGGAWGKMEGYIRQRLKQKNIEIWMSVKPHYDGKGKRPISIEASLTFNRSPFKVRFNIDTP